MRITDKLIAQRALRSISARRAGVAELQSKLATGKTFAAASDDPALALRVLQGVSTLRRIERFHSNAAWAQSVVTVADGALAEAYQAVLRVRELALAAASDSSSSDARRAMGLEASELIEHLAAVLNSKCGERYIFGGHRTTSPPFALTWVSGSSGQLLPEMNYEGDDGELLAQVADGVQITVSLPGSRTLTSDGMNALRDLVDALYSDSASDIRGLIDRVDEAADALLDARARVGAMMTRADVAEQRLLDVHFQATELLSRDADVDFAECIASLRVEENAYRMALVAGARLIQPSLLDFLS